MSNQAKDAPALCPFCKSPPLITEGRSDGRPPLRKWASCEKLGCAIQGFEILLEKWNARASLAPAVEGKAGEAFCEHGYPLEGPPWPPCKCRSVVCAVCRRQMFYDNDPRHEPELTLKKSGELKERYAHERCVLRATTPSSPAPDRTVRFNHCEDINCYDDSPHNAHK